MFLRSVLPNNCIDLCSKIISQPTWKSIQLFGEKNFFYEKKKNKIIQQNKRNCATKPMYIRSEIQQQRRREEKKKSYGQVYKCTTSNATCYIHYAPHHDCNCVNGKSRVFYDTRFMSYTEHCYQNVANINCRCMPILSSNTHTHSLQFYYNHYYYYYGCY